MDNFYFFKEEVHSESLFPSEKQAFHLLLEYFEREQFSSF